MLQKTLLLLVLITHIYAWYDVIPERGEVEYYNKKYFKWIKLTVVKYSRRSPYYVNLEGHLLYPVGNNCSMHILIRERLSNVYKPTFLQGSIKWCTFLKKDKYVGHMVAKQVGNVCPTPPGEYHLMNESVIHTEEFPYKLPTTWDSDIWRVKADINFIDDPTNVLMVNGSIYFKAWYDVIPERGEVEYYNKKYFKWMKLTVVKYSRRSRNC